MIASLLLVLGAPVASIDTDIIGVWSGTYRLNDFSHSFKGLNIPRKGPKPKMVGGITFTLSLAADKSYTVSRPGEAMGYSGTWKRADTSIILLPTSDTDWVRKLTLAGDGKSLTWLEPVPVRNENGVIKLLRPGSLVEVFRAP